MSSILLTCSNTVTDKWNIIYLLFWIVYILYTFKKIHNTWSHVLSYDSLSKASAPSNFGPSRLSERPHYMISIRSFLFCSIQLTPRKQTNGSSCILHLVCMTEPPQTSFLNSLCNNFYCLALYFLFLRLLFCLAWNCPTSLPAVYLFSPSSMYHYLLLSSSRLRCTKQFSQ